MDTLKTLIKLGRFGLDEQRRVLGALEDQRARLAGLAQAMEAEIVREREEAGRDLDSAAAFPAFAALWLERKRALARRAVELEAEIARARDALAAAFREVKQYEIAAEARADAARLELAQRQQASLDEVALTMFRQGQPHD